MNPKLDTRVGYRPIDLARECGMSVASVRFYEREGFIPVAERRPSGHRTYRDIHRDALITSRIVIDGYGWQSARLMMRTIHAGDIDFVHELIDAHHASGDRHRREIRATVELLEALTRHTNPTLELPIAQQPMSIGDAASWLGVTVATLRFWESAKLINPRRQPSSNFRIYDRGDTVRLRVIRTLRAAHYGVPQIRVIVRELDLDNVGAALTAVHQQTARLADQSRARARATAAVVTYLAKWPVDLAVLTD